MMCWVERAQRETSGSLLRLPSPSAPLSTSAGERWRLAPLSQAVPWVSDGAEGPAPAPPCRHHVLLSLSPYLVFHLKPERKDLRREHVLICFTISINYQVNEIPAHALGTLPRSFGLLTAAGAVRTSASQDAWQGTPFHLL